MPLVLTATNKGSLYDTYKNGDSLGFRSYRRAGCRRLSSPTAKWIDGNVDSGVRACLGEEFSSIHVLNLRGKCTKDRKGSGDAAGRRQRIRPGLTRASDDYDFSFATRTPRMRAAAFSTATSAII